MESSKLWNKLVRSKTRHFSKFYGKVGVVYISVAFPSHLENYVLNRVSKFVELSVVLSVMFFQH